MKEHFCPAEQSTITYQGKCNWCGESEGSMIETIKDILKGIDQTEIESSDGWWETSTGAKFGAEKLKQIIKVLAQTDQDEDAIIIQYHEATIKRLEKRIEELLAQTQEPEYAWPTVADYERDVGFQTNEAFRMAWIMARTTNKMLGHPTPPQENT